MYRIAVKMLVADKAKYIGLIVSIAFSTFLMAQQLSIFVGIIGRTASQVKDVTENDIWVMDPQVDYFDEIRSMPENKLYLVRGIEGVKWAVPMFKAMAVIKTDKNLKQSIVIGVDDASLVGRPPKMIMGNWTDLKKPNSAIIDDAGFMLLWKNEKPQTGKIIELNDRRVEIVGISRVTPPFVTFPILNMRYSMAKEIVPGERNKLGFILVKAEKGISPESLARKISLETGLQALTTKQFAKRSIDYYLKNTGIPINFGITVTLGFLVGAIVSGLTFYLFVLENLKQFGTLKAIGVSNSRILKMVLLQAFIVAFLGYSFGIGLATTFFYITKNVPALRELGLINEIAIGVAVAVLIMIIIASVASIRKVWKLEAGIVFRG